MSSGTIHRENVKSDREAGLWPLHHFLESGRSVVPTSLTPKVEVVVPTSLTPEEEGVTLLLSLS